MPYGDVFTRIDREYYQFTGAERKIADHIMLQRQDHQNMSISELAQSAGVAEATVSRFCRRLGYKGYSAFKLAVAGHPAEAEAADPACGADAPQGGIGELCRRLREVHVGAITQTMDLIDPASLTAAADLLSRAGRVLCVGLGGAMALAQGAAHLFSTALPNFYAADDPQHQAVRCALLDPGDAVLCYACPGAPKGTVELLKLARERGAGAVLVTRSPRSPDMALANVVLECGGGAAPAQAGCAAVRVGQLYLTDVLFHEVCRRDPEGCRERHGQVAEALAELRR